MADQEKDNVPIESEVQDGDIDESYGNDERWSNACSQSHETRSDRSDAVPLAADSDAAQEGARSNTTEDTVETGSCMPPSPLHPTILELDDENAADVVEDDNKHNKQSSDPSGVDTIVARA
ncbi:hypothetical protein LTR84_004554 [Exophiala bonariae]|uniref:Uncharacterized protein n=1 Tax=Exophiala bonariae TaxID=1690606 RepID=A0AAV9NMP8_9EURO|nr:hypothetical protein LTR84_004554 [Exophiala bonariae]